MPKIEEENWLEEQQRQQHKYNNEEKARDRKYSDNCYDREQETEEDKTRNERKDQEHQHQIQCMFHNLNTVIPVVVGTAGDHAAAGNKISKVTTDKQISPPTIEHSRKDTRPEKI